MAPKTTPVVPSRTPPPATSAIVDSRTGEVMNAGPQAPESEALSMQSSALLNNADLLASLDAASKAKPADFKSLEKDFWKPGAPGTPDAVLQGIFIGSAKDGRLVQHALVVKGTKGQPVIVRLNGTHSLTNALKQCKQKDAIRIEYMGEKTSQGLVTGQGQKFKDYIVTRLEA